MNKFMPKKNNKLNILIPTIPLGKKVEEIWPVNVEVNWVETEYVNMRPDPNKLKNIDVLIGTSFTYEMSKYANKLKAILVPAAGYEGIIVDALPNGTIVANAYHHEAPISEWVMMVASALDHNLIKSHSTFSNGSWSQSPARIGLYSELYNKTFGIIGIGNIGLRVAKLALAYEMKVIATGRSKKNTPKYKKLGIEYFYGKNGIDEILKRSDFVLISTPLTDATRNLIGKRELDFMKKSAYIINPARGHIINEESLYNALKNRKISGAAIDTWYSYPKDQKEEPRPSRFPFWNLENVIMTPHHSGATHGTIERRSLTIAENIDRLSIGKPLVNLVKDISKNNSI